MNNGKRPSVLFGKDVFSGGESCGSGVGAWAKGEVDSMILLLFFFGRERKHPPTLQVFRIFWLCMIFFLKPTISPKITFPEI